MTEKKMTVWLTQWWSTRGIEEAHVVWSLTVPNLVRLPHAGCVEGKGRNWHTTLAEAEWVFEKKRLAKIVGLKKQIAKLEKLTPRVSTKRWGGGA